MLLYSCHEEDNAPHTQGVALMLSKVARNALVGWESNGCRIIKASFKIKTEGITMNVIQCYASTNDGNDDIKDQFYERLQSIIEKCPRKDLTILMGGQLEKYQRSTSFNVSRGSGSKEAPS
ncbi:unnamed protein product [Schistosoma mattheei]|uniref:Uncharacterized protein n=1 Tax=Schistosoma mattheei TaxID=31246 RepID=A0A183Q563_9TREM|nr:unnamed protein product [Schistosoma mattheei]